MQARSPWVMVPENEAAWRAAERVRACIREGGRHRAINPLFIRGPSGTGKTHLVRLLAEWAVAYDAGRLVRVLSASELLTEDEGPAAGKPDEDLLVLEDVQHLPARGASALAGLLDRCLSRQVQVVCTATAGPALLDRLPVRLTSRLASGLVVGLAPLGPQSRQAFLVQVSAHRGLELPDEVLQWLAANLPGTGRQLEGALSRLAGLSPLTLQSAQDALREDSETHRPTVERIARSVGKYYQVGLSELRGPGRGKQVLLPRQVGMYLARQFTGLPLGQIGAYFGGRDHTTVLHACRKVEMALATDAPLSQAVRELSAGLS